MDEVITLLSKSWIMDYIQVADLVAIAVNEYGSNLVCLELEDELVFVDAGLLTSYTAEFREAMEVKTGKKASTLILSHAHIDHFFGIGAFSDCDVVAAESSEPRLERFVNLEYTEEVIRDRERIFPKLREAVGQAELRMPTTLVEDTLTVGDDEIFFKVEGGVPILWGARHKPRQVDRRSGDLGSLGYRPRSARSRTYGRKRLSGRCKNILPRHAGLS
jgi:glyoxylase-like metal-dependent hydrolase (beta-lactamase superfamily II)